MEGYESVMMMTSTCVMGMVIGVVIIGYGYYKYNNNDEYVGGGRKKKNGILYASASSSSGVVPLLGHALAYKKNPVGFLQQCSLEGGIVRINLAGRKMILVTGSDMELYKQVCNQPERILSSIQAVASVGFVQTLGHNNVFGGTDFQKACIKQHFVGYHSYSKLYPTSASSMISTLQQTFQDAQQQQQEEGSSRKDLFQFVRNWHIRFILLHFLGPSFYNNNNNDDDGTNRKMMDDIIHEFQTLQDSIEEATAAATVLPTWISKPFVLHPVQRKRQFFQHKLQQQLKKALQQQQQSSNHHQQKPWIQSFQQQQISIETASEYIVGILFAGAKNPAIATTQSYLLFHEHATPSEWKQAKDESKQILNNSTTPNPSMMITKCVLETLRYIAHPIGAIRIVQQPLSLGKDILLEPGECVALSHVTINHNPQSWDNDTPTNNNNNNNKSMMDIDFHRKEWASDTDMDSTLSSIQHKFQTFSYGIHKCPGSNIALIMSQCSLAILLSHNITFSSSSFPNVSFDRATLAQRSAPIPFEITKSKTT